MTKETLQKDLEKVLKKEKLLFTRLRTPNYKFRGVRYPADFVLWFPNATFLIECKQRKKLPLAPSDIRQLPFMQEWVAQGNAPRAVYLVLTATEEGYCVFSCQSAVNAAKIHKGLKLEQALYHEKDLKDLVQRLKEFNNEEVD